MIKPKTPFTSTKPKPIIVTRKPSLPLKRNQSIISNYSCLSDRIYDNSYKKKGETQNHAQRNSDCLISSKNYSNASSSRGREADKQNCQIKEKIKNEYKIKEKIKDQKVSRIKSSQHNLTGFQWLLIMRRCYFQQYKKRNCKYIKQRTLINYVSNKMYPDTLWNSIAVHDYQSKFTNADIVSIVQIQGKSKMNLDDIMICLSKIYKYHPNQENQSAAETARFVQQMKSQNHHHQSRQMKKPCIKNPAFITPITMDSIDINSFSIESNNKLSCESISPISAIEQTNNNISFSMQDSSQNSNYHSYQNLSDKFQIAFSAMQNFHKDFEGNTNKQVMCLQKKSLLSLMKQILAYCLYKCGSNNSFFYGLKINGQNASDEEKKHINPKGYKDVLRKLFSSQNFQQYFKLFSAIKIRKRSEELPYILGAISQQRIKILNLSQNNLISISPIKDLISSHNCSLQILNLNNNSLKNISELLALRNLQQLYLKNNKIDHMIVDKQKVMSHQLKIIDLSCNLIQSQEDLWALTYLQNLKMLNLYGNAILVSQKKKNKPYQMLNKQIIGNYPEVYIFSAYTQYKDIAFEQNKNRSRHISTSSSTSKYDIK